MGNVCQRKVGKVISVNIDIAACKWLMRWGREKKLCIVIRRKLKGEQVRKNS